MDKKNGRTANGTTKLEPGQHITKHELVATHLLEQGSQGISALSALAVIHDLNPRNSVSELRRNHGVAITDTFFEHQHSGGGITRLKCYRLADREQAHKLVALINHWRRQRNALPMEQEQIARYLAAFPATPDDLPPAA